MADNAMPEWAKDMEARLTARLDQTEDSIKGDIAGVRNEVKLLGLAVLGMNARTDDILERVQKLEE